MANELVIAEHVGKDAASCRVRGARGLARNLGTIVKVCKAGSLFVRAIQGSATRIVNNAKDRCPIDTGALRDSIGIKPKKVPGGRGVSVSVEGGFIGSDLFYGHFVEYGTSKMAARPFLRPAMDEERAQFYSDVAEFSISVLVGIFTTPIGGFAASFLIEDIGDEAVGAYVNRDSFTLTGRHGRQFTTTRQSSGMALKALRSPGDLRN